MIAKKKRKQGVVSWITSVIALAIGLSNVYVRSKEIKTSGWQYFTDRMLEDYTGFDTSGHFSARRLVRGYGPIIAAIAFKKSASYLMKTAKIQSIIPQLRA